MNGRTERTLVTAERFKQLFSASLLGYGFLRAWIVLCLLHSRQAVASGFEGSILLMMALAAGALVTAGLLRAPVYRHHEALFDLLFLGSGVLGICCSFFGGLLESTLYTCIGFATMGLCGGYFETRWGERFVPYPEKQSYGNLLMAFLLAAVLGIATSSSVSGNLFLIESLALLGIATVLYLLPGRDTEKCESAGRGLQPNRSAVSRDDRKRSVRTLACIVFTTLLFCFVQSAATSISYSLLPVSDVFQARFAANFIIAALLVAIFFLRGAVSPLSLLKALLPVTAAGLFLLVLDPSVFGTAPIIVLLSGNKLFDVLMLFLLVSFAQAGRVSPSSGFGLFVAAKNMGCALGTATGDAAIPFIGADQTTLFLSIGLLEVLLLISFLWMFSIKQISPRNLQTTDAEKLASSHEANLEERLNQHVEAVAQRFGLTPRETEILGLLARGKNRETIARDQHLSKSTVHTHVIHIYQKTNTHGQQELIELVEQETPAHHHSTNLV